MLQKVAAVGYGFSSRSYYSSWLSLEDTLDGLLIAPLSAGGSKLDIASIIIQST